MRWPELVFPLIACVAITACGGAGGTKAGGGSKWDSYDYARIARQKLPRDNDADYMPPITSCVDDAPGCQ